MRVCEGIEELHKPLFATERRAQTLLLQLNVREDINVIGREVNTQKSELAIQRDCESDDYLREQKSKELQFDHYGIVSSVHRLDTCMWYATFLTLFFEPYTLFVTTTDLS
jgi:hypothetical protein